MTMLTITDEGTRDLLEAGVWFGAYSDIWEDGLHRDLYNAGRSRATADSDVAERTSAVFETLEMLVTLREKVDEIRGAPIGTSVAIESDETELIERLTHCQTVIEENEEFWKRPPADRERMLATRDAADRLLAEIGQPAEVVA